MKLTNRHLAFLGLGIGAIGLAFEWKNIFPQGLKNPLSTRPIGTTAATGRSAVSATQATTGRVSPTGTTTTGAGYGAPAGRATQGSTLSLGNALTPIASFLAALLKPSSSSAPKPSADKSSGGGGGGSFGGSPSAPGGSAGRVDAGRGAQFDNNNLSGSVGTGPTQSSAYADDYGNVAYPAGDGNYADEWGNQVYIDDSGHVTYDATAAVGYVEGGEVFPNSYDPSDPSTYDYFADGGPLAAPDDTSGSSDFWGDGGPLADPSQSDFLPGDQFSAEPVDLGAVDPGMFSDDGWSDVGTDWGGGDGDYYEDNGSYDGF